MQATLYKYMFKKTVIPALFLTVAFVIVALSITSSKKTQETRSRAAFANSFQINHGAASVSSTNVTLSIMVNPVPHNMKLSNTLSGLDTAQVIPFQFNKSWTLPPGLGKKTVYMVYDNCGIGWSAPMTVTATLQ